MSLDVRLLRSSFELVIERRPNLTHRFYEILFERHPVVRPLFRRNAPEQQEKMLTDALVAFLDHLEDAPWLSTNLKALGARHVGYGVTDEMYDWVGACLVATLAEAGGPYWTPALASAWTAAYRKIASLMQAGATAE
jgi:hemoglobin-like flavoprotein